MTDVLFKDPYFWAAAAFFLISLGGIVWILKVLQKHDETVLEPLAPSDFAGASNALVDSDAQLIEVLERIEAKLNELKAAIEASKGSGAPGNPAQISQISEKVDKIYQILASFAGTEKKP